MFNDIKCYYKLRSMMCSSLIIYLVNCSLSVILHVSGLQRHRASAGQWQFPLRALGLNRLELGDIRGWTFHSDMITIFSIHWVLSFFIVLCGLFYILLWWYDKNSTISELYEGKLWIHYHCTHNFFKLCKFQRCCSGHFELRVTKW